MSTKIAPDFERFLSNIPLLHSWDGGVTWNTGGFQRHHLETLHLFLRDNAPASPCILETGAGNSTISFAFLKPAKVVSIAPDMTLFNRIVAYCEHEGISNSAFDIHVDGSEWVLPKLAAELRYKLPVFDFVLIDGSHNWPMTFVDFCYSNQMLKKGGLIMIDDVQLHSVRELANMLDEQPDFERVLDLGKSLVYRRTTAARSFGDWNSLPYIARKTDEQAAHDKA